MANVTRAGVGGWRQETTAYARTGIGGWRQETVSAAATVSIPVLTQNMRGNLNQQSGRFING